MGRKNMKAFFIVAVLIVALAVQAFALPDNPPTCSLSSSTTSAESTAVLTAVSVDTLANAGVESIKIYEDYKEISSKWCGYPSTCVSTKTVVHTSPGSHQYYAVCRDKAGQQTTSSKVYVSFKGINQPPVITSKTPSSSPVNIAEDKTQVFQVSAYDPDNNPLTYTWTIDGSSVQSGSSSSYSFKKPASGTSTTYTVAVQVSDGHGGQDATAWTVVVRDLEPTISVSILSGKTECDTFQFKATASSYDPITSYKWEFGDNTMAQGMSDSASHKYSDDGTYTLVVKAYDSDNDIAQTTAQVNVADIDPVIDAGPDDTITEGTKAFFSATASMPCASDAIKDYTWDFGDGSPTVSGANLHQTDHLYPTNTGSPFTVKLTVCDEDSCVSDTLKLTVEDAVPAVDFSWSPSNPIEGNTVTFTDLTQSYDAISKREWDFNNDGTVDSTAQNPTHTFDKEGKYPVCLTVTDSDGSTDTVCQDVFVGNNAPVVDLTANVTSGPEPLSVQLTCAVTGGNPTFTYDVDFGDGSAHGSSQVTNHVYSTDGTYTAKCTVTDGDGDTASDTLTITVSNAVPSASLVLSPNSGVEPLTVHADCTSATGNAPLDYTIDWGDGSAKSTKTSDDHIYNYNGTYTVTCTIKDADGDSDSDTGTVTVQDSKPVVDFTWSPQNPIETDTITFTSTVTLHDSPPDYEWDFGDGNKSANANPAHTYNAGGDFTVTLKVTDNDGSETVVSKQVHVADNPPQVDLYVTPLSGDEPLTVSIKCVAIGGDAPLVHKIYFGDGSSPAFTDQITHTYSQNGTYVVNCTVTDKDNDEGSDSETVTVADTAPEVTFTYSPAKPQEGDVVDFDATITSYDAIKTIAWDFGDGSTSSVEDPSHTYANQGTFTVTVTVTDIDGSTDSYTDTVTVGVNTANVTLTALPTGGDEPLLVDFMCGATGGNAPLDFDLDFGDGSTHYTATGVSMISLKHNFTDDGVYTVTCTVTDADSDVSTDSLTITVDDTEPALSFTYAPANPKEGHVVSFNSTVDAYDQPVTLLWDFGDGNTATSEDPKHSYPLEGKYNVTLTATDSDGSIKLVWAIVTVDNNVPFVNLEADPQSNVAENENVTFNCTVTDGNAPLSFVMDYGDGSNSASDVSVHSYSAPGQYTATCTVTDVDGDTDSDFVLINVANNAPEVTFTAVPTTGPEGTTVSFTCSVQGGDGPVSTTIYFGDGSSTTNTTASHTYALEGVYDANCTAVDVDSDSDSEKQTITITNNAPVVSLKVNATSGYEPLSINYSCEVGGGNAPFSYVVTFGDSTSSTSPTGTHDYTLPGNYTIQCDVVDVDGDADSDWQEIEVMNNAPKVTLTALPNVGPEGTTVDFTCSAAGGNAPLSYVIDFDDGSSTVTKSTAKHNYTSQGTYNATCTVTDADSDTGSDSALVTISNNAPVVNLALNTSSGYEPLSINYTCTVGSGNAPFTYVVDFGDGSATSSSPTGDHTYPTPGDYTVTCTVTDVDSDTGMDFEAVKVLDNPPVVDLIAVPKSGVEGMSVHFNCSVTGGNKPFSYVLDFGDGSSTTDSYAVHNYTLEGNYTATCTVTDLDLDVGTDNETIVVANNPPVVSLKVNTTSGLEPLSVAYDCSVGNGNAPFTYVIDFGDGSATTSVTKGNHTYAVPGTYTMDCTVTDNDGDVGSNTQSITVIDNPPLVSLSAVPTSGLEGMTVDFACTVTNGNAPFSYVLDFGDGSSTTSATAKHNYTLEGNYTATCTVQDADGDVGTDNKSITVANNPPVVNLLTNVSSGFEPLTVGYTCNVGGGNAPLTYVIDFGDGSPTTAATSGNHTYATPGNYTLSCTVTDVDSDTDTDTVAIEVINNPPIVDLKYSYSGLLTEGVNVSFRCDVTNGNAPFSYVIDFGDGSPTVAADNASHVYGLEGNYTATCTVTDFDGDVGTDNETLAVSNNPPVVNLLTNVTSGLEPLTVAYTCNVGGGNAPLTYVIDFGDGSPTTSATSGNHTYATPGNYTMDCTVTDVDSDTDTDTVDIEVINNPPIVDLKYSYTGLLTEGVNVSFRCDVTNGNAPFSYVIDFGDGSPTVAADNASHVYPLEGNYTATCTVTDFDGDVGTDSETLAVSNNVPVVNLVTNVTAGTEPLSVYFNCTLVGGGNAPFTYLIDFGDGSSTVTTQTATHVYLQNRSTAYNASCVVTDTDGDVSVPDTEPIMVYDSEPDTNWTYSPSSPIEGDLIQFTDQTVAYDGIASWSWNFGDGNTSTMQNPTHTYGLQGSYIVTLTVNDNDGSATSMVKMITVGNNPPVASLTLDTVSGTEPLSVLALCTHTGGNFPVAYTILWGDGTSFNGPTATHTYTQDGIYPVTCMATDIDGDVDTDMLLVTVNDTAPTADFVYSPANPSAGETVNFTDTSTAYDGISAWAWDFDNNGVVDSTVQNASRVFASPGLYVVNLTVTDADGSTDWTIRTLAVNVSIPAPVIFSVQAVGITNTSANITWGTDQGADSLVEYGTTLALGSSTSDATITFNHNMPLTGLAPNTTYYYNVTSCNSFAKCTTSGPFSFTTLVASVPDTTAPVVSLMVPADGSSDADGDVTVHYNVTDDLAATMICDVYSNTSGSWAADLTGQSTGNGLTNTHAYTGLSDGTYAWNVECSDGTNSAFASANFTFVVNTSVVDSTAPVVVLSAPADGSTDNDGNVVVQYTVTDDLASSLTCAVYSNTSGSWSADLTGQLTANASSNTHSYTGLSDGSYDWNVQCSDGTNSAFAAADYTFNVAIPVVTCGDGVIDVGEQCDDNNTVSGDGCSALCVIEYCGDSIRQSLTEQCDDGNNVSSDGCSSACQLENAPASCGNGTIDLGEECDGLLLGGFACSSLDTFTGGTLACTSVCTFDTTSCTGPVTGVCGDGVINPGESCDGTNWGPVSGCSAFGYVGGSLSCTSLCQFDTSSCTAAPTGQNIINSMIYGGFYPLNFSSEVTETTVSGSSYMLNATVQGTPVVTITDANLSYAILTNVSPISNCTVIGTPTNFSTLSNGPCVDVYIDPSEVLDSNTTGSSVMNSNISNSTATFSSISSSWIEDSSFTRCTISSSTLIGVKGLLCTITGSSVTGSTVDNSSVLSGSTVTNSTLTDGSTVTNSTVTDSTMNSSDATDSTVDNSDLTDSSVTDSTITDSTLINTTVTNSTVHNSTLIDVIVEDANITDGMICSGTVHDSVSYTATGCVNLTDVINYPPTAVLSASATSGTDSLAVTFSGSGSSDPNIPGLFNDSLSYSWDWDASNGITADATGVNATHTFGVGTHVVTLTVTDSFGKSDTDTVTITVTSSGSSGGSTGGGGGGGGGGRSGQTYILTLTPQEPVKSLWLKSSDTVKFRFGGTDYSFLFRYVYSDKAKMGVSTQYNYREYTLDEDKKYKLNLDDSDESDISILPQNLQLGAGNFTFELLNVEAQQKPFVLPFTSIGKKTVTPSEANESAELASEPAEEETEKEDIFSEGVLEFIESMSLRKSAPLWAGLAVSLIIILAGLGLYWLVTRKEE